MRKYRILMSVVFLCIFIVSDAKWYKGNTHMHSVRSDGDSPLEVTINWYDSHGYDFVVLTDHNISLDTRYVDMAQVGDDILIIPGNELTLDAAHCNAVGLKKQVVATQLFNEWVKKNGSPEDAGINPTVLRYQLEIDFINSKRALPIVNHPNFSDGVSEKDLMEIQGYRHIELFNGHPLVHNFGKEGYLPVEEKWDYILSRGKKVYGVASDDSHRWKTNKAVPGKGWIMVDARRLAEKPVIRAIRKGKFYSSTGVFLSEYRQTDDNIYLKIDTAETEKTISEGIGDYKETASGECGYRIEVVTKDGNVLQTVSGTELDYDYSEIDRYIRVRVSYTVKSGNKYRTYFAWTQPIFE